MPRKRSVKLSANDFISEVEKIIAFLVAVSNGQTDEHVTWLHNYAISRAGIPEVKPTPAPEVAAKAETTAAEPAEASPAN